MGIIKADLRELVIVLFRHPADDPDIVVFRSQDLEDRQEGGRPPAADTVPRMVEVVDLLDAGAGRVDRNDIADPAAFGQQEQAVIGGGEGGSERFRRD